MGKTRRKKVSELAREKGIDSDDALLLLWDAGFDDVGDKNDYVQKRDIQRARKSLGLATRRKLRSVKYWVEHLSISNERLDELLEGTGFRRSNQTDVLTKKQIKALKLEAGRLNVVPETAMDTRRGLEEALPPLEWYPRGHKKEPAFLDVESVEKIHWALVDEFGKSEDPVDPPGVKNRDLLGSAIFRPQTSIGESWKYSTLESAGAALLHSLILNHPFHNGNKRTALVSLLVYLDANGLWVNCKEAELFKLVAQVAQHRIAPYDPRNHSDREVLAITDWLCERSRLEEKGDRPIAFRRLRKILTDYECEIEHKPNGLMKIGRKEERKRRGFIGKLLESNPRYLSTQLTSIEERSEVPISVLRKIRKDLRLDHRSGVDSIAFYSKDPIQASEFIVRYKRILKRLAKF